MKRWYKKIKAFAKGNKKELIILATAIINLVTEILKSINK